MILDIEVLKIPKEKEGEYLDAINHLISEMKKVTPSPSHPGASSTWAFTSNINSATSKVCDILYECVRSRLSADVFEVQRKLSRHHQSLTNKHNYGPMSWHSDNHSEQILNLIVWLTDVDETCGPMQYITLKGKVVSREFSSPAGGKNLESQSAKILNTGGVIKNCTGSVGTAFLFDNNIYHRATPPCKRDRDALKLQIRISNYKI